MECPFCEIIGIKNHQPQFRKLQGFDYKQSVQSNYNKRLGEELDVDPFIESGQKRFKLNMKAGENKNIFGYDKQSLDDFDEDSDLEDLKELEQMEIESQKKRMEDKSKIRKVQNKYGQALNEG